MSVTLPPPIDLSALPGIDPAAICQATLLRQSAGHVVYRLITADTGYILKWFTSPAAALEIEIYSLLAAFDIETLPVIVHTDIALLLADLQFSPVWRLATHADMELATTGAAVAAWYRNLHSAGYTALAKSMALPHGLIPWVAEVTPAALAQAGERLHLQAAPGWQAAVAASETLKTRYLALPQTFNYNDFAAENLALSRKLPLQAVVFDYDCFRIGTAYSDWRNIAYSLHGAARDAFAAAYGSFSEQEKLMDEPLASLYGLIIASRRQRLPGWAQPLVADVVNGALERSIQQALDA